MDATVTVRWCRWLQLYGRMQDSPAHSRDSKAVTNRWIKWQSKRPDRVSAPPKDALHAVLNYGYECIKREDAYYEKTGHGRYGTYRRR